MVARHPADASVPGFTPLTAPGRGTNVASRDGDEARGSAGGAGRDRDDLLRLRALPQAPRVRVGGHGRGAGCHRRLASQAIAQAEADATDTALRTAKAQRDAQQKGLDQLRAGARAEEKAQAAARADEAQAAAKLVMAGARVEDLRAAAAQVAAAKG